MDKFNFNSSSPCKAPSSWQEEIVTSPLLHYCNNLVTGPPASHTPSSDLTPTWSSKNVNSTMSSSSLLNSKLLFFRSPRMIQCPVSPLVFLQTIGLLGLLIFVLLPPCWDGSSVPQLASTSLAFKAQLVPLCQEAFSIHSFCLWTLVSSLGIYPSTCNTLLKLLADMPASY